MRLGGFISPLVVYFRVHFAFGPLFLLYSFFPETILSSFIFPKAEATLTTTITTTE